MIDSCQITDKLIFAKEDDCLAARLFQEATGKRRLRWSKEAGSIGLEITYPLELKYRFVNPVLHHLVATINKSALISFLVKVDFGSNTPLLLTFYHTILLPLAKSDFCYEKKAETSSIFTLPDLIYRKIVLIC